MKEKSLQEFVTRYAYEVECPDTAAVEEFLASEEVPVKRKKKVVDIRPMVEEACEAGPGRVRLVLRDLEDRKVRLDEIMTAVFGRPSSELGITRTAVFGYHKGRWVEPLAEGKSWQAASL